MIAYRQQRNAVRTADVVQRLEASSGFERQMELGELETAVADALCADRDEDLPVLRALRHGEWRDLELPENLELTVPRGFAYDCVDPQLYRIAARRFVAEMHPTRVAVVGIRSIGTTLSRVVEDELKRLGVSTRSWTVRPTGPAGDRQVNASDELEQEWREWDGWFAVVDDGPGLSGSSFGAVAAFLANERIVLFPSWVPDASRLTSESGRAVWNRYPRYCAAFEELERFPRAVDFSAGKWREAAGIWPAVHPRHERRKYLEGDRIHKFAGFGRYGRAVQARAQALEGWIPETLSLENGFLASRLMTAMPAAVCPEFLNFAGRYLGAVHCLFATGETADPEPLIEMIAENSGIEWKGGVPEGARVVLDNRMPAHEWLETPSGYRKADALDHGDGPLLPGPHDSAWDVAGFSVEFGLDASGEAMLVDRYACESGDRTMAARLPFYRLAYLAFRFGYCDLAAKDLGATEDGRRFQREAGRYLTRLHNEAAARGGAAKFQPFVQPAAG